MRVEVSELERRQGELEERVWESGATESFEQGMALVGGRAAQCPRSPKGACREGSIRVRSISGLGTQRAALATGCIGRARVLRVPRNADAAHDEVRHSRIGALSSSLPSVAPVSR